VKLDSRMFSEPSVDIGSFVYAAVVEDDSLRDRWLQRVSDGLYCKRLFIFLSFEDF